MDTASRSVKESINETSRAAKEATDRARAVGESITETVAEAANAATNMSSKAAEQSREVMMMGMRTATGAGSKVADSNFGRIHRMMPSAAHAMDIYRDAPERSAEQVQALFFAAVTMGRGLQHMQHAWLEMMDHTMGNGSRKPQGLWRCKNIIELAEVQCDLYMEAINHAFASTSWLLELTSRTAQEAGRPLQIHHH